MNTLIIEEMQSLVKACTYKPGWEIIFDNDGERPFIQVAATTLCSVSGEPAAWKSGKTYLSPYMCRQEVVSAVYGAIEKAELHEIREFFRYKGASIFNPHLDPDVLAEVAKKKESFNMRDNAMSMEEVKEEPLKLPFDFTHWLDKESPPQVYTCDVSPGTQRRVSVTWDCGSYQEHNTYSVADALRFIKEKKWLILK